MYSNDVGAYACGSLAGDRITQAGQVSAEEPDKGSQEAEVRSKHRQRQELLLVINVTMH